ncbi:MAG: ATP-dependent DNA helicase RecG, partial [Alphaproteobacteria bacterium]|nr:ATP-dependent DNA helicase RecG [Alphaproteobacteria bacterium]
MRPSVLFPLFAEVTALKGVGPRMAPLYQRLCGPHVVDLLWHLPTGVIDRSYSPKLKYADKDRVATLTLRIAEHVPPSRPGRPYRIIGTDDGTTQITITYFNSKGDYLGKLYPTDRPVVVSGLLERAFGGWTMSHPAYVLPPERAGEIPKLEPVYPLTEGLGGKGVRRAVQNALARVPELPEWHDSSLVKREGWPAWKESLIAAHDPEKSPSPCGRVEIAPPFQGGDIDGAGDFSPKSPARRRLAYDELLADQLALAVIRRHHREAAGRAIQGAGELQKRLEQSLPFSLTAGQRQALAEIGADMAAPKRMLRLLQGDVGSGKTVVALFAMLQALESGMQAALMVPTEILARQHHTRLTEFLEPLGIKVGLLVGKGRGKERQATLHALAEGSLGLVVGTHALFQGDVAFKNLGLAVVDEQHRFGVQQRLQLSDKGRGVDILAMTATPIPRTLTLTAYGDMDVSRLLDKPAGRQPIDTRLIDLTRLDEVIEGVKRQIAKGAQVFWVCPLVEESENSDLAAATARAETLRERLASTPIGLVHGRMANEDKDKAMTDFADGKIRVLVATTVIEVGVDVPDA